MDRRDRPARGSGAVDPRPADGDESGGARRMIRRALEAIVCGAVLLAALEATVAAHSGPPFPIVSNRALGAYSVSIWTDPDTTDNGKPAGQFWIELEPAVGRHTGDGRDLAAGSGRTEARG